MDDPTECFSCKYNSPDHDCLKSRVLFKAGSERNPGRAGRTSTPPGPEASPAHPRASFKGDAGSNTGPTAAAGDVLGHAHFCSPQGLLQASLRTKRSVNHHLHDLG